MVELHFDPGVFDLGMDEGRAEIGALKALDLALVNGFARGEKPMQ